MAQQFRDSDRVFPRMLRLRALLKAVHGEAKPICITCIKCFEREMEYFELASETPAKRQRL